MSHYHLVGALVTAYHSDETRCGPGEHTRHDAGRPRYEREMVEMWKNNLAFVKVILKHY